MIDLLADIQHQKLCFTGNPIVVNIDPVILGVGVSRADLRYRLKVYVQAAFQSGNYTEIAHLEASEQPPSEGSSVSDGAYFLIEKRLHEWLKPTAPVMNSTGISVCAQLVRQFYTVQTRHNGASLLDTTTSVTAYAYRGGISERDYDTYKDQFFTGYIGSKRRFLTWQPDFKKVTTDQPEFLHFLTNFTPCPTQLQLRVRVTYSDNTQELLTRMSINGVTYMTVYAVPVGFEALALGALAKEVISYTVWLSNQDTEQVSEARTYEVVSVGNDSTFLLYLNGLGGWDTLRCTGNVAQRTKATRQLVERFGGYGFDPSQSDALLNDVSGERTLDVGSGNWVSPAHRQYFEDLLLSREYYVADKGVFVPIIPVFDALTTDSSSEFPIERMFTFRYANERKQFSDLPPIKKPVRAVEWRPYVTSCELSATGLRTGRRVVNALVLYYAGTNNMVKPVLSKDNVPGTEGYLGPQIDSTCDVATTPYKNVRIERLGSYVKQGCVENLTGEAATIVIEAGVYGSELSQADADAKAEVAFDAIDTQDYANANGTCVSVLPWQYSVSVPAGHYHYRTNDPAKLFVCNYYIGTGTKRGNAWWVPESSAPYKFPMGTHDFAMPVEDGELTVNGQPGRSFNIKIYRNGTLQYDKNLTIGQEYYRKVWLFNTGDNIWPASNKYAPASGDKMYVQLTWL